MAERGRFASIAGAGTPKQSEETRKGLVMTTMTSLRTRKMADRGMRMNCLLLDRCAMTFRIRAPTRLLLYLLMLVFLTNRLHKEAVKASWLYL